MSIVERASSVVEEFEARTSGVREHNGPEFQLDFSKLSQNGFYTPESRSTQLALEMRAVKRRLLRRIGFLRSSGDRDAYRSPGRQKNLILVTSTRASEGKTFSSINLALSLALEDKIETLLVDADIPRPKVRAAFGLPAARGLTDRIKDESQPVSRLTWKAKDTTLSFLPEGSRFDRASDLYSTAASMRLWTELSVAAKDRLVIIDAPPTLATTESIVLAKYADEIIFVVEANSTPEPAIASAVDELLDVNPNVSLLLNRCLIGSGGSHYGSYDYYDRDPEIEDGPKTGDGSNGV